MSRLFQREVYLDIIPAGGGASRRIRELRISFSVSHRGSRSLSTANVSVFNPSRDTIGLLTTVRNARATFATRTKSTVRLWLGYGGTARLGFQGNPIRDGIRLDNTGVGDRVLTMQLADGGLGFTDAYISESFTENTPWSEVIDIVLRATGWSRGEIVLPTGYTLPGGGVFMARASEILDRAAALVPPHGGTWFVRDGALYIVPLQVATSDPTILISATKGNLVGSPSPTEKGVRCTALIDPTMRAGRAFVLESRDVAGLYVANDVSFNGDSGYAQPYYMELTGKAPETV